MNIHDARQTILASARHDVELIRDLAQEGDAFLESRSKQKPEATFSKDEAAQLRAVAGMLFDVAEGRGKKATTHVSENVSSLILRVAGQMQQRRFFAEMALVYLVTRLEAFLKDYFAEYLLQDPRRLRSSNTLTYEQALSFSSMTALKRGLADREAEKLGYGSIDDVAQAMEKRFSVRLSEFPNWTTVREMVYRRNLLVHNKGIVNDVYRSKMGYRGKEAVLKVDAEYLAASSSQLLEFFDFVHTELSPAPDASAV